MRTKHGARPPSDLSLHAYLPDARPERGARCQRAGGAQTRCRVGPPPCRIEGRYGMAGRLSFGSVLGVKARLDCVGLDYCVVLFQWVALLRGDEAYAMSGFYAAPLFLYETMYTPHFPNARCALDPPWAGGRLGIFPLQPAARQQHQQRVDAASQLTYLASLGDTVTYLHAQQHGARPSSARQPHSLHVAHREPSCTHLHLSRKP